MKDALDEAGTGTLRLTNTAPLSDGRFVLGVDPKVERDGKVAAAKGRVFESVLKRPDGSSIEFSHAVALTAYRDHLLKLSISRPRVPVDAFVNQSMGLAAEFLKFNPDAIDAFFVQPPAALPK